MSRTRFGLTGSVLPFDTHADTKWGQQMSLLKNLARILPLALRAPVRDMWRRYKGNVEFHALALLADKHKGALDIGANCGVYTAELGRLARTCVAFEPNPPLAAEARDRARAAGLTNVRVEACALSDQESNVTFRVPVVDGVEVAALATIESSNDLNGAEIRSYTVPCRRLDDFELEPVGLIKVDAEGHETAILDGARALIERDSPAVMIEVEERHKRGSVDYVRRFFDSRGYDGYFLLGRQIRPISEFDFDRHQDARSIEADKVRFDAVYVNNFIFAADHDRKARLRKLARSRNAL